ncbi:MAG: tetratricopeptide repeat protein [Rhodocyclales bacterium]|nr:tetratricopeptide repeat protein [Rhodocyclales bacterium]
MQGFDLVPGLLNAGVQRHQAGALEEAERFYRQVLAHDPRQPDASGLLGIVLCQTGRVADGIASMRAAVKAAPKVAGFHMNLGNALRETGKAAEALQCFQSAIRLEPGLADAHFNLGLAWEQTGRLGDALGAYGRACDLKPDPGYFINFGNALQRSGRTDAAIKALQEATRQGPDIAAAHYNLGNALAAAERWPEAAAAYRRAVAVDPGYAEAHHNLGRALKNSDRLEEGIAAYRRAVELRPELVDGHVSLGVALREAERADEAIAAYETALRLAPDNVLAHYNLGNALRELKRFDEAQASFRRCIDLDPMNAKAANNIGLMLSARARYAEAGQWYQRAAESDPTLPEAHMNLGCTLQRAKRLPEALESLAKAIDLKPDYHEAFMNVGNVLKEQRRFGVALRAYEDALAIKPDYHDARLARAGAYYELGRIAESLAEYDQVLEAKADALAVSGVRASVANYSDLHDLDALKGLHADFAGRLREVKRLPPRSPLGEDPLRRLRVGYVSADLRGHSVAWFMEPVLAAHDRTGFELVAYHNHADTDATSERLKPHFDRWVEVPGLTDEEFAERVRDDRIDILVDLSGQTAGNRLPAFARKPAPVQMTWLGYLTTTGVDAIDYRITDARVDPEGYEQWQVEKPLRIDDCYICYGPHPYGEETAPVPAGPVVFGSFNNVAKMSPANIALWARLLHEVPDAVLRIKSRPLVDETVRVEFAQRFARHGIGAERLELIGWEQGTGNHLAQYNRIHVALDTWPYHGVTTTCEALWMGVPVVSLVGATHASRQGLSLLSAVGLQDLAVGSHDDYVACAAALAQDRSRLAELRMTLRSRMLASPLTDAAGFARKLEAAYRGAWQQWCKP